ncbi:MAG: 50S ribosomal protein L32 [Ardenticatenaceae bacterium]
MALPKKKMSRTRRNRRRAHYALKKMNLVECPQCHSMTRPHHVCPSCGNYRGVPFVEIKENEPKS